MFGQVRRKRFDPDVRVVYVDNDPLVLTHACALLTSSSPEPTMFLDAGLNEPEQLLQRAGETLDLTEPVAVMLIGTIGHVDATAARPFIQRFMNGVASGSYLALNQATNNDAEWAHAQDDYNSSGATPYHLYAPPRSPNCSLVWSSSAPLVSCTEWALEVRSTTPHEDANMFGGIARKPLMQGSARLPCCASRVSLSLTHGTEAVAKQATLAPSSRWPR